MPGLSRKRAPWTTAQLILAMSYWQLHRYQGSRAQNDRGPGADRQRVQERVLIRIPVTTLNSISRLGYCADSPARVQEQVLQTDRSLAQTGLPRRESGSAPDYRALGKARAAPGVDKRLSGSALLKVNQVDHWDIATLDYLACGVVLAESGDKGSSKTFVRSYPAIQRNGSSGGSRADHQNQPAPTRGWQSACRTGAVG